MVYHLKSRAIFLFWFCFTIFLIFSFHLSLALCIKTHTKKQEMALKRLNFSKISGEHAPGPSWRFSCLRHKSGKFVSAPPPKISKPVRTPMRTPNLYDTTSTVLLPLCHCHSATAIATATLPA